MAVSQKQIAEKIGVSIALVSRVLSGKASEIGIARDTIDRVMAAAAEMGYVPSAAALSLKGKSTRTIGVAVYDFNDPFFGSLIKEIQTQAHEHDYSLILAGFLNRVPDRQDLQSLHKHAIDGLIVVGSDTRAEWLDDFSTVPVARIGHGHVDEQSVRISVDEQDAAGQIVKHLVSQGCNRSTIISAPAPMHLLRCEAFKRAAGTADMACDLIVAEERDPFSAGLSAAGGLLGAGQSEDALICTTDQVAMGVLHALTDAGVGIPGDVSVTGFDDIPEAARFIPPLTTIQQPLADMVQKAFSAIVEPFEPSALVSRGSLIVRQTA